MKLGDQAGTLWFFESKNKLPQINPIDIKIIEVIDVMKASKITNISTNDLKKRFADKNHLYAAQIDGNPIGYGWAATKKAQFGEPSRKIKIPAKSVYLWDFATYPEHRGKGVYPTLIQKIMKQYLDANYFWILNQTSNSASARGIQKAGFKKACRIYFTDEKDLVAVSESTASIAEIGAHLLGIHLDR